MFQTRQPIRYSIQRANGPKWKTIHLEEDQVRAFKTLQEVVRVKPRGYFRLIRLDHNPDRSTRATVEFDWKLLELYDPKQGGFQKGFVPERSTAYLAQPSAGTVPRPPWASGRTARSTGENVPMPVRVYVAACVLGALLAIVLTVVYGPDLLG